jgi:RNA polymerase sigma-70 factor (ECF subfamily)
VSEELTAIVGRCLSGHQASIRQLIDRFRGQVFGLCYKMLRHREDAEDATQETFLRVVKNLHRWDSNRAFEPWLLTIAGNRCRTQLAKRGRNHFVQSLDYQVEDLRPSPHFPQPLREEVDLALDHLRDEYRLAFELFHDKGLSYQEIAESLNVPLGTVKTWVHRARRELITKLRQRGVLNES